MTGFRLLIVIASAGAALAVGLGGQVSAQRPAMRVATLVR